MIPRIFTGFFRGGGLLLSIAAGYGSAYAHTFYSYGIVLEAPTWPASSFPARLAPDLVSTAVSEKLDSENVELYATTINSNNQLGYPQLLATPTRIDQLFTPEVWSEIRENLHVEEIRYSPAIDTQYIACPEGQGLDLPYFYQVPVSTSGTMSFKDLNFGGIGTKTTIVLGAILPGGDEKWIFVIQWRPPGRYRDVSTGQFVNAKPGVTVLEEEIVVYNHQQTFDVPTWVPSHIVEWVSTDAAGGGGARAVDAGDLSALAAELGYAVRWGFPGEPLPYPGSPPTNYHVNFAPFGQLGSGDTSERIDSADLSAFAADLAIDNCWAPKKAAADIEREREAVLAWFAVAPTGRLISVVPGGEPIPEYDVFDPAKMRRAALDPYGYRRQTASTTSVQWGLVKSLFK